MRARSLGLAFAAAAVLAAPRAVGAAQGDPPAQGWRVPPPEVVALLDAAPTPEALISPDGRFALLLERAALPPLDDVLRDWVGLAGVRIDTAAGARHRASFESGLVLVDLADAKSRRVALPEGARIASVEWSHTGRLFAFSLLAEAGYEVWVGDVQSAAARRAAGPLVAVLGDGFAWMPDGARLLCQLAPAERGPAPARGGLPSGPIVQQTEAREAPLRTYQDLLQSAEDAELFDHFARAQLAVCDPSDASVRAVGAPAVFASASVSPDGRRVLVARLERPYSLQVPHGRFAHALEVWDLSDGAVRHLADVPLAEAVPIDGVPLGPRDAQWMPAAPASVVWVEALDGGDPRADVPERERWMQWAAPFEGEPLELCRLAWRARGIEWLPVEGQFVTREYDRDRRWTRALVWTAGAGGAPASSRIVEDRSVRDHYGDPGAFVTTATGQGGRVLRLDGPWAYRIGEGNMPGGARPFLARVNLFEGEAPDDVLWRSAPGSYEQVVGVVQSGTERRARFVTRYESPEEPPNYRLRDLEENEVVPLSSFADPAHAQATLRLHKELVSYARADGVQLSATLYRPEDLPAGERLPLFVWAYPLEYNDPETAGQVRGSPYRYTRIQGVSPILLATRGWVVLENATMPIVGDAETVNDTFIEQIVASAEAAIAHAADLGVADPERAAVGGHSYGAFMAVNLLAHSDLFRAGVARSGAYNRTLTPFGFQSERRTLWEAPELYWAISPFLHADQIDEPLLILHGERDENAGTFPLQSDRLFQAIQGTGGLARYVKLPGEGHGYRARESVLHATAETLDWLERYVRDAPAREPQEAPREHE